MTVLIVILFAVILVGLTQLPDNRPMIYDQALKDQDRLILKNHRNSKEPMTQAVGEALMRQSAECFRLLDAPYYRRVYPW